MGVLCCAISDVLMLLLLLLLLLRPELFASPLLQSVLEFRGISLGIIAQKKGTICRNIYFGSKLCAL